VDEDTRAAAGLGLGLLIGTLWAYVLSDVTPTPTRLLVATVPFIVGGMVAGAILGGALKPRLHAAKRPAKTLHQRRLKGETGPLVSVSVTDDSEARLATEVLEGSGATRVDAVSGEYPIKPGHPSEVPSEDE
jgi:hypothetical protein